VIVLACWPAHMQMTTTVTAAVTTRLAASCLAVVGCSLGLRAGADPCLPMVTARFDSYHVAGEVPRCRVVDDVRWTRRRCG